MTNRERVFELTGEILQQRLHIPGRIQYKITCSADGRYVAVSDPGSGGVYLYQVGDDKRLTHLRFLDTQSYSYNIAFLSMGHLLLQEQVKQLHIMDPMTWGEVRSIRYTSNHIIALTSLSNGMFAVALSNAPEDGVSFRYSIMTYGLGKDGLKENWTELASP